MIAALTLSPQRFRRGLYFHTKPNGSFNGEDVAQFLRQLLRHLRGRVIVVWDRWSAHRGKAVKDVVAVHPRLELVSLPAYAPTLNPVEHLWSYLKWAELCNFAPVDANDLNQTILPILQQTVANQALLLSFWKGTRLPLPRCVC